MLSNDREPWTQHDDHQTQFAALKMSPGLPTARSRLRLVSTLIYTHYHCARLQFLARNLDKLNLAMGSPKVTAAAFKGPAPLLSQQPFMTLYTIFFITRFCVSLPFRYLYYAIPPLRRTPERTIQQDVSFDIFLAVCKWTHATRFDMGRPLTPAKAWKDQFVIFDPPSPPSQYFTGFVANSDIQPEPVPGCWYPHRPAGDELRTSNKRVFIHFHGGAYVSGSYDPAITGKSAALISEKLPCFILSVGYRKAAQSGCHFPTQLVDAITAYQHLVGLGVDSSKIILSGDSSGGHLALNLLKYILDNPSTGFPKPGAVAVASPWTDLRTDSATVGKFMSRQNYKKDYVDMDFIMWARDCFIPPQIPLDHPYLSLLDHPFDLKGVPTWVETGMDEVIEEETAKFADRMSGVPGNVVELHRVPGGPHDVLWSGTVLGFQPLVESSIDALRTFLERHGV